MSVHDDHPSPAGAMSVRQRLAILLCLVIAAAGLPALPASAHSASKFYAYRWIDGQTVTFYFDDSASGGFPHVANWRYRMENAMDVWNNSDNDPDKPRLRRSSGDGSYRILGPYYNPCGLTRRAGLFHAPIYSETGTALGSTRLCVNTVFDTITGVSIVFNSSADWYVGTGSASGRYDLYGAAVHELGHATGWGWGEAQNHFGGSSAYCVGSEPGNYHTMCPKTRPGWTRMRTLEPHDLHTWHAAY